VYWSRSGGAWALLGFGPAAADDRQGRDGGQEDAIAGADGAELVPDGKGNPLAARAGDDVIGEGIVREEVKWADEGGGRIKKGNEVRPGDVLVSRWMVRRSKKNLVAEDSGAIGGVS
jgi:hypothetical protein